jgi:mycothiol synthase
MGLAERAGPPGRVPGMTLEDRIPERFQLRPASVEDAPAVTQLINEVTIAEVGVPWVTLEETRDDLTSPGRDPLLPETLLVQGDGTPAGYLQSYVIAEPFQVVMLAFVRQELWGRGLSAWLLRLGEERARRRAGLEPPGTRAVLHVSRFSENEAAGALFASLGYGYVRTFWIMRIELGSALPDLRLPDGIGIRAFEPGDEVSAYAALAEAFADHWGSPFPSFEEWRHHDILGEGSRFDPGLWFLATDGAEVVGVASCRATSGRAADTAVVAELGVRRGWRRRGVGLALLQTAFAEFRRRGISRAELSVDAESTTGATRLYERAGMHVWLSWEVWEKELRPRSYTRGAIPSTR